MLPTERVHPICIGLAIALAVLAALPANAQNPPRTSRPATSAPPSVQKQATAAQAQKWEQLNGGVLDAIRAGDYLKGGDLAKTALAFARRTFGDQDRRTLTSLSNLATLYRLQGRYREAESLLREEVQTSRKVLGPRDPDTLTSINNLAAVYREEARFNEAEPLYQEALRASRELLGSRHPQTLVILSNLAALYEDQGRAGEAEQLMREVLDARRDILGPRHPQTLTSLNNLATLYEHRGRYGEAEALFEEVLQTKRRLFGPRDPQTLTSVHMLATLYVLQHRHDEAEALLREAVNVSREMLGPRHPDTLANLGELGSLYSDVGRYDEAEPLLREAVEGAAETLGPQHPDSVHWLFNLAGLRERQGRYDEAERLAGHALRSFRDVLGPANPNTLTALSFLGTIFALQGRYGDAEPIFKDALARRLTLLGPRHPDTLSSQLDMIINLVKQRREGEASPLLRQMEPNALAWLGQELYSTTAGEVRRRLARGQMAYQDLVMSLATAQRSADAQRLAADVMLHFKLVQGEEEAYLARLTRRSANPQVRALADEIGRLRIDLAAAARSTQVQQAGAASARAAQGAPDTFEKLLQVLEAKQKKLAEISSEYTDRLQVLAADLEGVRAALPAGAVLIEFRQFRPLSAASNEPGEPRFAGLLLGKSAGPAVVDVGPVSELPQPRAEFNDEAAAKAYLMLFAPFEREIASASIVYLVPDDILNYLPFARLRLADGRYWIERQQLRVLQTGRDLLRNDADRPARGLLALGGLDYGGAADKNVESGSASAKSADAMRSDAVSRAALTFRNGFARLPATLDEVKDVAGWYQLLRVDEPVPEIWSGSDAVKKRLLTRSAPPRVLHLATHGFCQSGPAQEPMLLCGLALSGANSALRDDRVDGILFALETQSLNLDGTELVVLSACDTVRGAIDYSEGVFGLARALRTAGARNTMVTLWKLADGEAHDFIVDFYKKWLTQPRSDPAKALRDTQLSWIKQPNRRNPDSWAPYVVIE
jgi:CHAT domain-containing protein/tetratricopeptide (TPR) repeat protein